jgi:hypothetical protein
MFSALLIEHFFSLKASKELTQPSVNITDLIKLWKLTMKPMKDHPGALEAHSETIEALCSR